MVNVRIRLYFSVVILSILAFSLSTLSDKSFFNAQLSIFIILNLICCGLLVAVNLFTSEKKLLKIFNWISIGWFALNATVAIVTLPLFKNGYVESMFYGFGFGYSNDNYSPMLTLNVPFVLLLVNIGISQYLRREQFNEKFEIDYAIFVTVLATICFIYHSLEDILAVTYDIIFIVVPIILYFAVNYVKGKDISKNKLLISAIYYCGFLLTYFIIYAQFIPVMNLFIIRHYCSSYQLHSSFTPLFFAITSGGESAKSTAFIFNYNLIYSLVFLSIYLCLTNRFKKETETQISSK